ncbi:hypothetical protein DFH94DRAFT_406954 [Russula ochroleuca]|jgi:hypothetical protein|uniref:Uncharacterized protein n=1 Tax=Russula ochroleuca TaxID=152965 RepID=A0A9P5MY81_9AGAM|nr:hypothetical protein DFH94DRAFT_406954 [Russula ochroleuca]
MAPVLKVLLEFLRIVRVLVRIARDYIKCFPRRGASLLALLGRKLNMWSVWPGKSGSFGCLRPTEPPFPGTKASSYSVSGGLGAVREYVVAASSVPASASHPSLHEHTERQPAAITQTVGVHPPVPNRADSPHPLGGRSLDNRSFGNLSAVSIQSRASDRLSIMINLRESTRAPLGQPSRRLRAPTHPYIHGSMTIHSSLESLEPRPSSPASSNPTMDRFLPEGRFVQLIHSNQVSRYIKEITMQVEYTIL